jgi:hypothetical protein
MSGERGRVDRGHNGRTYTHVEMYHHESDAIEKSKELQTKGYSTWIEKGGSSEYYPYRLYCK